MDEKKKEKEKKSKTSPFFSRQEEACRVKKVLINLYAVLRNVNVSAVYTRAPIRTCLFLKSNYLLGAVDR